MRRLVMAVVASMGLALVAHASLIPEYLSGPVSLGGGNFLYVYQATVSDLERLDPSATNGKTCTTTTTPVKLIPCVPAGTFFTIYDIGGLNAAATMAATVPTNWSVSVNLTGLTPSTVQGMVPDDPSTENVTFKYTGPVISGPATIGGFDVISTDHGTLQIGFYSSQATEKSTGLTHQEDSFIMVPGAAVPEPASLALIGAGLIGLAFARKRFKR